MSRIRQTRLSLLGLAAAFSLAACAGGNPEAPAGGESAAPATGDGG